MRLHLVDGTFELFRSFYGAPSSVNSKGEEIAATRAFTRGLYALIRSAGVSHVGVAFDTTIESFRNALFEGYKTGEGIDPKLWSQAPWVEKAAEALGVVVWSMVEFEADDALATAAARWSKDVQQVLICSPDKDLYQCVKGKKIVVWDRIREKTWDEKGVKEKLGVTPASIPDYLALVGDTADGIPGVPGWGAKSTATILSKFGAIEKIPADSANWGVQIRGAEKLAQNLNQMRVEAKLYRKLATLRTDVPLKQKLKDLEWKKVDLKKLEKVCEFTGDESFYSKVLKERK